MLHGHAKIELKNVKTGETQVIEHDNMMTNWLKDILSPRGVYGETFMMGDGMFNYGAAGVYDKSFFFKGLVMFENAFSNSADDYIFPMNNNMVAHGDGEAYNGTDLTRGSFNDAESVIGTDSASLIWDFNQEHGNGTISALGLCNSYGGRAGAGQKNIDYSAAVFPSYREIATLGITNINGRIIFADTENSRLVALKGLVSGKITLLKYQWCYDKYDSLTDVLRSGRKVLDTDLKETVEVDISSYLTGSDFPTFTVDGNDLCIMTPQSNWNSGASKTIVRINLKTNAVTTQSVTNRTGKTLYMAYYSNASDTGTSWAIWNGFLYAETSDRNYVYINLADDTDCGLINDEDGNAITRTNDHSQHFLQMFGQLFISPANFAPIVSGTNQDIKLYRMNTSKVAKQTAMSGMYVFRGSWTGQPVQMNSLSDAYAIFSYFGNNGTTTAAISMFNVMCMTTKQNLDNPVTKTSDMTMRVTYTIREAT